MLKVEGADTPIPFTRASKMSQSTNSMQTYQPYDFTLSSEGGFYGSVTVSGVAWPIVDNGHCTPIAVYIYYDGVLGSSYSAFSDYTLNIYHQTAKTCRIYMDASKYDGGYYADRKFYYSWRVGFNTSN